MSCVERADVLETVLGRFCEPRPENVHPGAEKIRGGFFAGYVRSPTLVPWCSA
jgi:hypothetical protein